MHYKLKAAKVWKTQYWYDIVIKQVQLIDNKWKWVKNMKIDQKLLDHILACKVVPDPKIDGERELF